MNLLNQKFVKQLTNFIAIFGVTTAVVFFSSTALFANHQAKAQFPQEISIATANREITQTPPDRTPDGVTPGGSRPQSGLSELDRLYVIQAGQGGMTEVQMARLALQRSKNDEIRRYAEQMIQEHTPVNQQLMQLANQKRITPPTTIGPKYQAAIAQLSQFSGRDFDQAYKEEAGLNLHMEYLITQRRESQLGQDPDLKAFATKNIPIALRHLELGQRLLTQPTPQ